MTVQELDTKMYGCAEEIVTHWFDLFCKDEIDPDLKRRMIDDLKQSLSDSWNRETGRLQYKFRQMLKDVEESKRKEAIRWKKRGLCRKHVGALITHDCGKCMECGNMTNSGMYQRCHECAEKQNKCMRCEEAIVVVQGS